MRLRGVAFPHLLLTATAKDYLDAAHDDGKAHADLAVDEAHFDYDRLAFVLLHSDDDY
jgi:hypothetical protein